MLMRGLVLLDVISNGKQWVAAVLALVLLPLPPPSTSGFVPFHSSPSFQTQAVSVPLAWVRRTLLRDPLTEPRKGLISFQRAYHARRPIAYLSLGVVGLGSLLIFGHRYERWVESWADGSMRLMLFALELLSFGALIFVCIVGQVYEARRASDFRIDWPRIYRMIKVGIIVGLLEAVYYSVLLPYLVPGQNHDLGRARHITIIDAGVSLAYLDAINQYYKLLIVERYSQEEAMLITQHILLRFFLSSAPLWLSLIFAANYSFTDPIHIFWTVTIAMDIWDFQLYTSDHKRFRRQPGDRINPWIATLWWLMFSGSHTALVGWFTHSFWASMSSGVVWAGGFALFGIASYWSSRYMPIASSWKHYILDARLKTAA